MVKRIRKFFSRYSSIILFTGGLLLILYIFIPQLGDLKEAVKAVEDANILLVILAIIVFCSGFPAIAAKYCKLVNFPIKYIPTLKVQIASAFISKLLPMSVGSLTVNTFYLTKKSGKVVSAAAAMTINAMTSTVSFVIIILLSLIATFSTLNFSEINLNIKWYTVLAVIVILVLVIWGLMSIKKINNFITSGVENIWANLKTYKKEPRKLFWGVSLNFLGSMTGILTLYICCKAVGLHVNVAQCVLSYTFGNIIGSLVPTPGGLGGVEAGLYGGLVFFGFNPETVFIAVMVYRLITYWLPIIPGFIMYRNLRKTELKDFKIRKKAPVAST